MDIHIHMEKKHLIIFSLFLVVMFAAITTAQYDSTRPWHPLVQISGDQGSTSVDADDDGIIDQAFNTSACGIGDVCQVHNITATGIYNGNGSGLTDVPANWTQITSMPAGFADNVDNGFASCYTAESGAVVVSSSGSGTTASVSCAGGYTVVSGGIHFYQYLITSCTGTEVTAPMQYITKSEGWISGNGAGANALASVSNAICMVAQARCCQ